MRTLVIASIAFAGGVGVGLLVAKFYARSKVQGGVDSALDAIGLGGGKVQAVADSLVAGLV